MKRVGFRPLVKSLLKLCSIVLPLVLVTSSGWAGLGEHASESPTVKFMREGDIISATLISRAKSTSVRITFTARGGRLVDVVGTPFAEAAHPEVDYKDFKSDLFTATLTDIVPGGEVALAVSSDFFSKSTEYWLFTKKPQPAWQKADVDNIAQAQRVRELIVKVADGGSLDADGAADGRITIIGGPKDSFWGYALGTLFIRFFGIFLVLSVLMAGMYLSGRVFQILSAREKAGADRESARPDTAGTNGAPGKGAEAPAAEGPSTETVLAISTAIHMELASRQSAPILNLAVPEVTSWTQQGRDRIMAVRFFKH